MVKVEANGKFDAFIIQNVVQKLDDLYSKTEASETAELNGLDPDQKYIRVCMVGGGEGDNYTENLADHGIWIGVHHVEYTSSFLPVTLFKDRKEGDTIKDLHVYGWGWSRQEGMKERELFDLVLPEVTLAQGKYRYRGFGNGKFDEVLKDLIDRAA